VTSASQGDLFSGARGLLIWGLPIAVIVISARLGGHYPVFAWPPALGFMGAACLYNARRCGRLHCYLTGPFFLALALVSLLYGIGALDLGSHGWSWLSLVLLVGGVVLTCVPEWLFGKYLRRGTGSMP